MTGDATNNQRSDVCIVFIIEKFNGIANCFVNAY